MKKLITPALLFLALSAACGCGALLQSLSTTPSFSVGINDILYDGQSCPITTLGLCTYAWEVSDPELLILQEMEDGRMSIGGVLPEGSTREASATLTARNATDENISPVSRKITIKPWNLAVYDASGALVNNPNALKPYTVYTVKMVTAGDRPSVIEKVVGGVKLGSGEILIPLAFTLNGKGYKEVSKTELSYTFLTPSKGGSAVIEAAFEYAGVAIEVAAH